MRCFRCFLWSTPSNGCPAIACASRSIVPNWRPRRPRRDSAAILDAAYAAASAEHTDDAALVQSMGTPVWTVPGDERSFKITTRAISTAREPSWLSRR
jgi:hypothetical protein